MREIVLWLKENKNNYATRKDILKALNNHFNSSISIAYLNQLNFRYKLSLNTDKVTYSKEMFQFMLKGNFETRQELCDAFNKKFNLNLTLGKLRDLNTKHGFNIGNPTRNMHNLQKGWIKTRGYTTREIGEEIERGEDVPYIKLGNSNYVPKHRYLYEKYHNVTLGFDDLIIFLDDDKTNFNKENLYKVPRSVAGIMVGNDLNGMKATDKATIVKFCEWKQIMIAKYID
jgi:hypothetical protein